jgi:hypothetical protein
MHDQQKSNFPPKVFIGTKLSLSGKIITHRIIGKLKEFSSEYYQKFKMCEKFHRHVFKIKITTKSCFNKTIKRDRKILENHESYTIIFGYGQHWQ